MDAERTGRRRLLAVVAVLGLVASAGVAWWAVRSSCARLSSVGQRASGGCGAAGRASSAPSSEVEADRESPRRQSWGRSA
jgi:hypothetical protein